MGVLSVILAMLLAFATYVENDYGANASRYFIYNTWWFELLFLICLVNLLGSIILNKLYVRKKLSVFMFHLAFVFMIIGAGITRFTSVEGMMHIREGEASNEIVIANYTGFSKTKNTKETKTLPFALKLNKFTIERYPGSNSPSSFVSDVVVKDAKNGKEMEYSIYMNHILKYQGYRFFQSSYDQDEKGTILSVSKDSKGIFVTYTGYFLMILFFIISLLNKNSLFRNVTPSFWKNTTTKSASLVVLFLITSSLAFGNESEKLIIPRAAADEFGELLVQDQKGRTKPLYTISHDILRKISKKPTYNGLTPMQVFLGFYYDFEHWKDAPVIKVSNKEIRNKLGINDDFASFEDFIDLEKNTYKLSDLLTIAYSKPVGSRSKLEKEAIKIDERLNICFMIHRGDFLRIFPVNNETKTWYSPTEAAEMVGSASDSVFLSSVLASFFSDIKAADFIGATEKLNFIKEYQFTKSSYAVPSALKIKLEIVYYKTLIFERLFPFYACLGILFFGIMIYKIAAKGRGLDVFLKILQLMLYAGFLLHTFGILIRWYVSGHAPMSNGYETMIFISWVIILAGILFQKKTTLVLAATALLASLTLLVAHLSFMDPEITNLVPVLQSYWLTLHVSVITSSYAFLGLAAMLGIVCLVLYSVLNKNNSTDILKVIDELTVINYKSMTIGLYLLTTGTFLGAVWANESWGRYWGWDPKETWSLITIIVYSFVIHSRMIATFKSIFVFNLMSLIAFSSVLMTYFGVNYYLSGLHSYAGGDPVPIPVFVYISIAALTGLSIVAYSKYQKIECKVDSVGN
jgi:cytochrome c-type biogenesis protein CcsB